jgi:hypothetical protein
VARQHVTMKQRLVSLATAAVVVLGALALLAAVAISGEAAYAVTQLIAPGIPTDMRITPTSITFSWKAPAGPVASYTIQVAEGLGPYHDVATTTGTTYTSVGLAPDTAYYHRVIANPAPGSGYTASDPSFALYAITLPPSDTVPPSKPGTPTATPTGPTTAAINTTGSTDNDRVAGYWVQRQVGGVWTDWVASSYGGFALQQLTGNTTYTVAVVAFDRTGNRSPRSDTVTFTTPPYAPAPTCKVQRQVLTETFYVLTFTLDNQTAATVVTDWTLTFRMPAGQTLISAANLSRSGDRATLGPAATTARLDPGTTATFGFYADRPVGSPLPSGFTLTSPATGPITCTVTDRTG